MGENASACGGQDLIQKLDLQTIFIDILILVVLFIVVMGQ